MAKKLAVAAAAALTLSLVGGLAPHHDATTVDAKKVGTSLLRDTGWDPV